MKVIEAIDRAKTNGCVESAPPDVLRDAILRLEKQIAKKAGIESAESIPQLTEPTGGTMWASSPTAQGSLTGDDIDEAVLLACGGGVAEGYDDMYDAYLKREACRHCEAWESFGNYDTIFVMRYSELCKEILRERNPVITT